MATAAALVGHKLPDDAAEDSYDISAALFGKPRREAIREATVHHSMNDEYGIRKGDWVLLESPKNAHGAGEPAWWREKHGITPHDQPAELFHLQEDLLETHNVYAQYPERVKELRGLLERYKADGRSVPNRR